MRKHIFTIILPLAVMGMLATSCSKDEDYLDVELSDPTDNFIPKADDDSETAQLRNQFKEETGSYLRSEERRVGKSCRSRFAPYH